MAIGSSSLYDAINSVIKQIQSFWNAAEVNFVGVGQIVKVQDLDGRRAALDLRCSTSRQTGTSIFDQDKIGNAFCRANGLTMVKTFKQEGVTASVPGARTDFDDIIRHKREQSPQLPQFQIPCNSFGRLCHLRGD